MKMLVYNKGCIREEILTQNLRNKIKEQGIELVYRPSLADVIVYVTCAGLGTVISDCITEIEAFHRLKKEDTIIIVTGCLTKIPALMRYYEDFKDIKIVNNMDFIVPVLNIINDEHKKTTQKLRLESNTRTFFDNNTYIQFFLCRGCINNCSFCKTNYMHEPLVSLEFDSALKYLQDMVKKGTKYITLSGQNITLYGIDLYKRPRLHEFIHELSKTPGLLHITVNELTTQNMYPELLQELISNPKVDTVSIQIESASNAVLEEMNRHYTLEQFDAYAKPLIDAGKFIKTVLMSGFPHETYEDLDKTINYLKDRGILTELVCKYCDFGLLPSSKLEQLSKREKNRHTKYLRQATNNINYGILLNNIDKTGDAIIYGKEAGKVYLKSFYTGYSLKKEHQELELGSTIKAPAKRLVHDPDGHHDYLYRY